MYTNVGKASILFKVLPWFVFTQKEGPLNPHRCGKGAPLSLNPLQQFCFYHKTSTFNFRSTTVEIAASYMCGRGQAHCKGRLLNSLVNDGRGMEEDLLSSAKYCTLRMKYCQRRQLPQLQANLAERQARRPPPAVQLVSCSLHTSLPLLMKQV